MPTKLLYQQNSYLKTTSSQVLELVELNGQTAIILDQTIFYAQGGGQPADQGTITGEHGTLIVTHVSYNGGNVQHKGTLSGELKVGDTVELQIDWELRYYHMQLHSAGHILDQAIKNVIPDANSVDGNHGIGKKNYIEFTTSIAESQLTNIQNQVNQIVTSDLPILTEMISYEELIKRQIKLPFDLPTNKPLRIVQIGNYPAMPDGGTQLKSTGESWPITVIGVQVKDEKYRVLYSVQQPSQTSSPTTPKVAVEKSTSNPNGLNLLINKIASIKQQLQTDLASQSELETKYLGKKGLFNELAKNIKDVDSSDRKEVGQLLNELKNHLEQAVRQTRSATPATHWVDLTMPGITPQVGHIHPVSQAIAEIVHIFEQIGFTFVRYPEIDWDWYAFESLNMPPDHPARDEWETFFVDVPDTTKDIPYDANQPRQRHPSLAGGKLVLTPHTSNGQVREMERLHSQPPIRMINIGRCYRRQQDATHTQMFHQFEGLVVDKGINIQHLKGTLDYFAEHFYGPGTKSRIRPFHFQFTEPSFEVDFSCHICHGTGVVTRDGEEQKCRFCKSGWHEVGGAGMVHPNVLKAGGIDPDEYTGFAFGWGIERTYTLKEGLNIDDIRLLYSGDLRFLEQF